MLRAFNVLTAPPNSGSVILLCAPACGVASRKLARLNTLKPCASNFKLNRSVTLKIFDIVMSAYHCPGPTNVLRPKFLTQPKQGAENVMLTGFAFANQPFAHWSCVALP